LVSNTAFGDTALDSNTTGTDNTAFGYQSLTANTIGTGNTAFGHESLLSSISGVQKYGYWSSCVKGKYGKL
jgi:hypothetical protein